MKVMKAGVLIALVLVSAVVVVASPAFATPNITASSGTRAVAPFITPLGNTTTSSITAPSTDSSFATRARDGRTPATLTCRDTRSSGYVDTSTHTQGRITRLDFTNCRSDELGAGVSVTTTASSANPFFLHVRSGPDANGNSTGTFNIPTNGSITVTVTVFGIRACSFSVGPQSVRVTFNNTTTILTVNDSTIRFSNTTAINDSCPDDRLLARQTGTFNLRADTTRDDIRVTAAS